MLCLGLSGGLNRVHENPLDLPGAFLHDGAAVLVRDGHVVAAVEEERLNRIKHSNKFPAASIRYCLESVDARLEDLDRIAFYATEAYCNSLIGRMCVRRPDLQIPIDAKFILLDRLRSEFQAEIDPDRIVFVGHHMAHSVSAFAMSGFEESLVLAIDGYGDFLSGMVAHGQGTSVTQLETFSQDDSLGLLYLEVIRFIGYGPFDEYKVMGLAPYGDPATYRKLLGRFYELHDAGEYGIHLDRITPELLNNIEVRRKGQPFTQQHKDLGAALQEALERILFHILRHRRQSTGLRNLCLAGGVAHNCTMNGKLMYSGLFDDIFVQPAAHDAGCALGAALMMSKQLGCPAPRQRLTQVYWGPGLGEESSIGEELGAWKRFLDHERPEDTARLAAQKMAEGAVIGWVQGRSEFGPRALGNRSILADPRPAENKSRINAMIKKREGYRPFAPSALEEDAREIFELPARMTSLPFMIFVVRVREDKRQLLGAITHVDGTARPHTVSRETNPEFWNVIHEFKKITGVPILLNTSFNNNVEPIVDSVEDSIAAFLTTGLDYVVIGPYIAKKREVTHDDWLSLHVSLPPYSRLNQIRAFGNDGRFGAVSEVTTSINGRIRVPISQDLCGLLMDDLDGHPTIGDLFDDGAIPPERQERLVEEFRELWALRLVKLNAAAWPSENSLEEQRASRPRRVEG